MTEEIRVENGYVVEVIVESEGMQLEFHGPDAYQRYLDWRNAWLK